MKEGKDFLNHIAMHYPSPCTIFQCIHAHRVTESAASQILERQLTSDICTAPLLIYPTEIAPALTP